MKDRDIGSSGHRTSEIAVIAVIGKTIYHRGHRGTQREDRDIGRTSTYRGFTRMNADQEDCQKCQNCQTSPKAEKNFYAEVSEERRGKSGNQAVSRELPDATWQRMGRRDPSELPRYARDFACGLKRPQVGSTSTLPHALRRSVPLRMTRVGMVASGGKSPTNHLICPATKSYKLLDTSCWIRGGANEEANQRDREWRDAPERD